MTNPRPRPTKRIVMLCLAFEVSRLSTCRRNQVGCVLTDDDFEQIAIGYNGTYSGGPNDCLMPDNDPCGCIHAEVNALVKAKFRPTRAFVTTSPCLRCATLLINAHVKEVIIGVPHANQDGTVLLKTAGIDVITT